MQGLYFRSSATSIPASISAGSRRAFTAFWNGNWNALAQQLAQTILANISRAPEYSRDWTTLYKDMQAAARLIGIRLPGRGRSPKKLAR